MSEYTTKSDLAIENVTDDYLLDFLEEVYKKSRLNDDPNYTDVFDEKFKKCKKELLKRLQANESKGDKGNELQDVDIEYDNEDLHLWFGLSYASFLVLPRVCMMQMPEQWQKKMAKLLNEYDEVFIHKPNIGTRVQAMKNGKLVPMPEFLKDYRRPKMEKIKSMMREDYR